MYGTAVLKIPRGYEVIKKTQTAKINRVVDLLMSETPSGYSEAVNNHNGTATLIYSVVRCPYCGRETPVRNTSAAMDKDAIDEWASEQFSLISAGNPRLTLTHNLRRRATFRCDCCGRESSENETYHSITASGTGGKIKISRKIHDIKELLDICAADNLSLSLPFIYYETLVFNLKKGRTYIQIEDAEKNPVWVRDVTENPESIANGVICNLISSNDALKREIKRRFEETAAFNPEQITLESLILAARFIGYDSGFYRTIPFLVGTYKLYPGFKGIADKMHFAAKIPALYKHLNLPMNKRTRKIIFTNPGLMFYHNEIIKLRRAVNNIDYFNRILSLDNVYMILAKLNCYPAIYDFLADAFRYGHGSVVMKQITQYFQAPAQYALRYAAMSERMRALERKQDGWLRKCNTYECTYGYEYSCTDDMPSLPSFIRFPPDADIPDCEIDGYKFSWLMTTNDYTHAGREMHNCLATVDYPVVAVKSNGKYVAAISFDTPKKIADARMCRNRSVRHNVPLCIAIQKWCERYNIEWDEDNYDDTDYDF